MENNQIIIIGVFVFFGLTLLLISKKMKEGFGVYNVKVYGITLIIFSSLIVLLSNISPEKTAACFGIFGSIAGYLFGLKTKE